MIKDVDVLEVELKKVIMVYEYSDVIMVCLLGRTIMILFIYVLNIDN